jgi:hypothetical protein
MPPCAFAQILVFSFYFRIRLFHPFRPSVSDRIGYPLRKRALASGLTIAAVL